MKIRRRRGVSAGADLTPMIDVVFQLILFFLVSTTFAVLPAINVNLPESETSQAQSIAGITITATATGKLFFNDEKITIQSMDKKLKNFDTEGKKR
ncbi:ExbD/TolR family protein, partial [Treponema berlinense]